MAISTTDHVYRTITALDKQEVRLILLIPQNMGGLYRRTFNGTLTATQDLAFSVTEGYGHLVLLSATVNYLAVSAVTVTPGGPPYATITVTIEEDEEID